MMFTAERLKYVDEYYGDRARSQESYEREWD